MADDIVERLRAGEDEGVDGWWFVMAEAADEIERLRNEVMSDYNEGWEEGLSAMKAENERLREANATLQGAFRVNMLRAFPSMSHEEIDAEIKAALGESGE